MVSLFGLPVLAAVALLLCIGQPAHASVPLSASTCPWSGRRPQVNSTPAIRLEDFEDALRFLDARRSIDFVDEGWELGPSGVYLLEAALFRKRHDLAEQLLAGDAMVPVPVLLQLVRDSSDQSRRILLGVLDEGRFNLDNEGGEWLIESAFATEASPAIIARLAELGAPVPGGLAVAMGWRMGEEARSTIDGMNQREWSKLLKVAAHRSDSAAYERVFGLRSEISGNDAVQEIRWRAYDGRWDLIEIASRRAPADYDPVDDPAILTSGARYPQFVETLLRRGADPNRLPSNGFGPLHTASRHSSAQSVRLLLAAGADPEARSYNGRVPLFEVSYGARDLDSPEKEARCLSIVEALLEAGADPCVVDDVGRVPVHCLLRNDWSPENSRSLRKLLSQHTKPDDG